MILFFWIFKYINIGKRKPFERITIIPLQERNSIIFGQNIVNNKLMYKGVNDIK